MLNVVWKNIVTTNSDCWAIKSDVSEQVVLARKQHLEKTKKSAVKTRFNINDNLLDLK